MKNAKRRRGRLMAAALISSLLMGTAPEVMAAEAMAPAMEPKPTIAEAATAKVSSLSNEAVASAAVQDATSATTTDSEGFFKSSKGRAALVLMIAAVGITVYSKYNDRVKSVIR